MVGVVIGALAPATTTATATTTTTRATEGAAHAHHHAAAKFLLCRAYGLDLGFKHGPLIIGDVESLFEPVHHLLAHLRRVKALALATLAGAVVVLLPGADVAEAGAKGDGNEQGHQYWESHGGSLRE